jgi:xanthine phosphoribosyltransferase
VALDVPVVFARKIRPVTMPKKVYERHVPSRTKGGETLLIVSSEFLGPGDRIVIIDDFLATGQTLNALANMVVEAKAHLLAFGVVVEKTFEHGRRALEEWNVPLESLVVIERMSAKKIIFGSCSRSFSSRDRWSRMCQPPIPPNRRASSSYMLDEHPGGDSMTSTVPK